MKKIIYQFFLLGSVVLIGASCKKNITDLNTDPTLPVEVTSAALFTNASVNLSDQLASTNVNTNNFRLFAQYWTETIYRDETRYNLNGRSIPDRWWAGFYRDVIKDLSRASEIAPTETSILSAAQIKNRKAINEILTVYAYYHLLTTFGNVPYSEALDIDQPAPKYDDAAEVFGKIATRLNDALAALDNSTGGYGSGDVIMHDDIDGWKKFANSLKFKMGMLVVDSDPATAQAMITASAANVIANNTENITMNYLSAPPNTNPVWEDIVQSGRHDFVGAKQFVDLLNATNDPRLPSFFDTTVATDPTTHRTLGYVGRNPGNNASAYNNYSQLIHTKLATQDAKHTFFSYAEMEFLKAEAVERGIAVGGTAEQHYNNGIDASVEEWGGTAADALAYRSQPEVAYTTATGDYKEKIGVQSWIAYYNRGYDGWTQWRRLDHPTLVIPFLGAVQPFKDGETPDVIKRMTYPVVEQNLNTANYDAAAAAIGKDQITQKLWFDKF